MKKELDNNLMVCPHCDYHFRINARTRIAQLVDEGTFEEMFSSVVAADPLEFVDTESYKERQRKAKEKNPDINEAVITGLGEIDGEKVALAVMDFEYMGGSMGSAVGEKVTRIIEEALKLKLPVIAVTASGGARMQEGMLSLMQMARTTIAVKKLKAKKLPYITILSDPTMGGVTASFAMLGDVALAEPGAAIGFAGKRVIEQIVREKLPSNFQQSSYLLEHGMIDQVVHRKDLKKEISNLLNLLHKH